MVLSGPELIAYVPDDGLHIKVRYRDDQLVPPEDNEFDLAFVLDTETLNALNDRRKVTTEADAKAVALKNESRILAAIDRWLRKYGPSYPRGGPRRIRAEDLD